MPLWKTAWQPPSRMYSAANATGIEMHDPES
jgi:hypothetical protein